MREDRNAIRAVLITPARVKVSTQDGASGKRCRETAEK